MLHCIISYWYNYFALYPVVINISDYAFFFCCKYLQFILYFLVNQSAVNSSKLLVVKSVFFQKINISNSFDRANSYLSLKHNGQCVETK